MGCYNETCMITGLPIFEGDPCTVVFLIENPYDAKGCYTDNAYSPVFIIDGIYDGYGYLKENDTPECRALKNLILLCSQEAKTYKSDFHEFTHKAQKGEIVIYHSEGVASFAKTKLHMRPVFLHGEIKDMVQQNVRIKPKDAWIRSMRCRHLLASIECYAYGKECGDENEYSAYLELEKAIKEFTDNCLFLSNPNPAAKQFLIKCIQKDKNTMLPVIKRLAETNVFLEDLRKAWHIPSGLGSQEGINDAYIMLCSLLTNNL